MSAIHRLLVVGGNGYLGSAVCRAAVGRGWNVTSISSSGRPALTPGGHARAWTKSVDWVAASAFNPQEYASLVGQSTAVVHTLGILMENNYKKHVRSGNLLGLIGAVMGGNTENRLGEEKGSMTYESMNRDAALLVLQTMLETPTTETANRPFVYVSAEDIFRPFVPDGYIRTKRQAEQAILRLCADSAEREHKGEDGGVVRPVLVRPGLMYHPHDRPLSTLPAVLLDMTSRVHASLPFKLPLPASPVPTPLSPSSRSSPLAALGAVGASLQVPPIHVDHVAECICRSVEDPDVRGVVDTRRMRGWVGLDQPPTSVGTVASRRTYSTINSRSPMRMQKRTVTIYAPGPPSQDKDPRYIIEPAGDAIRASPPASGNSNGNENGATIDHRESSTNGTPSSQHPFASLAQFIGDAPASGDGGEIPPPPPSSSNTTSEPQGDIASFSGPPTTSSQAPQTSSSGALEIRPQPEHPFDTHAFVQHMEKSGFESGVSRVLMEATKALIVQRGRNARGLLLHKEDTENAAYLFKAALSELRTELSVKARNDGMTLRSTASLIRREVDSLSQKLKEDIGTLKHDIEMDMNNRKAENRSDQKGYDIAIEEINNKFTISLGDLKTEIEQAKWDATRRAITIIAGVVFSVISVVTLSGSDPKPASTTPTPPLTPPAEPRPLMKDAATSPRTEEEALLRLGLGDLADTFGKDTMAGQYGRRDRL